jgi:hypothetical protein
MEQPSPARLYAAVIGAALVVLGIVDFFYYASFGDRLEPALGAIEVNAWLNLLYVLTGAVGILVAGVASRQYALAVGFLYTLLGILGPGTEWFHLVIGLLGLAAVLATPSNSEARAKPAGDRA